MARAVMEDVRTWCGRMVIDSFGDRIGRGEEIFFDEQTVHPEWALINTGMLGDRHNFVPLAKVRRAGEDFIQVPYTEEQISGAPAISASENLTLDQERELYEYYGVDWTQSESSSLLPRVGARPAWGGDFTAQRPGSLRRAKRDETGE